MAIIERRTIDELIARYTFEPTLRDVYVEGQRDQAVISWFLSIQGCADANVLQIDNVLVPSELIARYGLRVGRRGAVITLAMELCARLPHADVHVTCVADRDGENVTNFEQCDIVRFTDFSSLEMYFFDPRVIAKVLSLGAAGALAHVDDVLESLKHPLSDLFAIRMANIALGLNLDWLSFERCCALDGTRIEFDIDDFVQRYLSKSAQLAAMEAFVEEVGRQRHLQTPEPRMRMHGHDFVAILTWYLRQTKLMPAAHGDEIRNLLSVATEASWLREHALFDSLYQRMS